MRPDDDPGCSVRPLGPKDVDALRRLVRQRWASEIVVVGGRTHIPHELAGFVAERDGMPVGYLTLDYRGDIAEIVTLDALSPGAGIGTALVDAAAAAALEHGATALAATTTNDNLRALRFYQRRGFRLVALRPGAVDDARLQKASIPNVGEHGIPLHDEIELRRELADA